MEHISYLSADKKTNIHAVIWRPEGKPCGVVQIIHGMCEYIERYAPLAGYLTERGFIVCGEDHLGHGKTAASSGDLGYFNDERSLDMVLADIRSLHQTLKKEAGELPYFMLGHSMGSFFCRAYIARYGAELSGAVIMGTGYKSKPLLVSALAITSFNALFKGWKHRSNFIHSLAFGSYNKRFKAENNEFSWLSADRENIAEYKSNPLNNFRFTNNGYYILFSTIKNACSKKAVISVPKNLPVYFVAGDEDPVGDYSAGVKKAYSKFKKAGVHRVDIKLYKGARHEILNDFCKDEVRADLLNFFNVNSTRS